MQHDGSPCTFDRSRPAASQDDNTGDEDDSGGSAAGCVALRSSATVAAPSLAHSYRLPGKVVYSQHSITRQLSSRAPPF
jgi:hypothetical protein